MRALSFMQVLIKILLFVTNTKVFYLYIGVTSLMVAAENGRIEIIETLLQYGTDINAKDNDGQ